MVIVVLELIVDSLGLPGGQRSVARSTTTERHGSVRAHGSLVIFAVEVGRNHLSIILCEVIARLSEEDIAYLSVEALHLRWDDKRLLLR